MNISTITFPSIMMSMFESRIAKLNKRAAKLNMPELGYSVDDTFIVTKTDEFNYKYEKEYVTITVTGEVPVVAGWNIVARIEYEEGMNLIRGIADIPTVFRERKPFCDHCKTKRAKKHTVVIKNVESGEYMQVGSSCLKDFIPVSVKNEMSFLNMVIDFVNEIEDDSFGRGGGVEYAYKTEEVFDVIATLIKEDGFASTSEMYPTKVQAIDYFTGRGEAASDMRDRIRPYLSEDRAKEIMKWIDDADEASDFFFTLKNIVKLNIVGFKWFGYIAGGVFAYNKAMEKKREVEREAELLLNEYVDVPVKTRTTFDVELIRINSFETMYGYTYLHTFRDMEGRTLVWFGSKVIRNKDGDKAEDGDKMKIKATVKGFDEYRNIKQTIITRTAYEGEI